ncbi:tetratricopeptide repeat protein [Methanobrevibacter sp.]|uniref:tetratricopeptide repeat protein n=1 Tax=Methanobrevibacter sp. TaxID=66852 RepID=UPI00388FE46A
MSGERKVGENFDSDKADSIFDKLKNVEGKIKPKKEDGKLKNISNLMNEAKYLENKGKLDEAIDLYKQVIFELPDASKAYGALANIYAKQGDVNSENDVLKKAISNCKDNKDFKNRLKEIE